MATIDYGAGDVDFRCTLWTYVLYEQEFANDPSPLVTGDLAADVMGVVKVNTGDKVRVTDDGHIEATIDYTKTNWPASIRALWAMLRTEADVRADEGREFTPVPSYREWSKGLTRCEPDMRQLAVEVARELLRGSFRSGAAASGKTS